MANWITNIMRITSDDTKSLNQFKFFVAGTDRPLDFHRLIENLSLSSDNAILECRFNGDVLFNTDNSLEYRFYTANRPILSFVTELSSRFENLRFNYSHYDESIGEKVCKYYIEKGIVDNRFKPNSDYEAFKLLCEIDIEHVSNFIKKSILEDEDEDEDGTHFVDLLKAYLHSKIGEPEICDSIRNLPIMEPTGFHFNLLPRRSLKKSYLVVPRCTYEPSALEILAELHEDLELGPNFMELKINSKSNDCHAWMDIYSSWINTLLSYPKNTYDVFYWHRPETQIPACYLQQVLEKTRDILSETLVIYSDNPIVGTSLHYSQLMMSHESQRCYYPLDKNIYGISPDEFISEILEVEIYPTHVREAYQGAYRDLEHNTVTIDTSRNFTDYDISADNSKVKSIEAFKRTKDRLREHQNKPTFTLSGFSKDDAGNVADTLKRILETSTFGVDVSKEDLDTLKQLIDKLTQ